VSRFIKYGRARQEVKEGWAEENRRKKGKK